MSYQTPITLILPVCLFLSGCCHRDGLDGENTQQLSEVEQQTVLIKQATDAAVSGDRKEAFLLAAEANYLSTPRGFYRRLFRYDDPSTWWGIGNERFVTSMAVYQVESGLASELAGASMALLVELDEVHRFDLAEELRECPPPMIETVARVHASRGGVETASFWARRLKDRELQEAALRGIQRAVESKERAGNSTSE